MAQNSEDLNVFNVFLCHQKIKMTHWEHYCEWFKLICGSIFKTNHYNEMYEWSESLNHTDQTDFSK